MPGTKLQAISNLLHDRVDAQEELRLRSRAIVDEVVRGRLGEALDLAGGNASLALNLLAVWVSEAMADVTTDAVKAGASFAEKREAL